MRFKRSGIISRVIIVGLMVYLSITLLNLRSELAAAQAMREELSGQVTSLRLSNERLRDAIENKDDPEVIESVARDKGYVKPGETLYIDVAN